MTSTAATPHRSFDVLVIGAGPAGASAAFTAAKLGLTTALIDKSTFPRHKLCGGGLTGRSTKQLKAIFGWDELKDPAARRTDMHFFAFGEDLGVSRDAPAIDLIMRHSFDHSLVEAALAAGAVDFTGVAGTLDLDTCTFSTPDEILGADVVIAADGVNSPTARLLFGTAFDKNEIGFALELEHPEVDNTTPLRIDFGAADWGYGWQFPKAGSTTIGVGGVMRRNEDMKAALARYCERLGRGGDHKVKGQFLPFGAFRKIPGKGRVLLAGDAAGLVDPITGEGIAHALKSGALAAEATAEALQSNAPDTVLARYRTKLKPIHQSLIHARRLRPILFRERLRPAFIRSFRNSRSLRADYLRLLAGETEYGPIMRKMFTRLPTFAWRVLRGL